jgi:hypothetical protein
MVECASITLRSRPSFLLEVVSPPFRSSQTSLSVHLQAPIGVVAVVAVAVVVVEKVRMKVVEVVKMMVIAMRIASFRLR